MAGGAVVLLVVLLGLFAPLVLYLLVRGEHERPTMRREDAERIARRNADDRDADDRP
ncbi:MAG: hypothetical protein ABEJ23_00645 [Haloarculaceae archaeon]